MALLSDYQVWHLEKKIQLKKLSFQNLDERQGQQFFLKF
jgi:hypothetical protein